MRHEYHLYWIDVHWQGSYLSGHRIGRDELTFKVHHDFIITGGRSNNLQKVVWICIGPDGNRAGLLASGVVALAYTQRQAQHQ